MGETGPQQIPLNQPAALALPVDAPNPSGGDRWFLGTSQTSGNAVTAFIRVAGEAYPEMGRIMKRPSGAGDFIYLLGWDLDLNTNLGGDLFRDLIVAASNQRGVAVRAMLFFNQQPGTGPIGSGGGPPPQNQPSVDFINSLANGGAIHDNRYLNFGSHHQKVLVVKHQETLTAFCGGMDIHSSRNNWHDVHLKIEGPGALAVHQVFVDRWKDHPLTRFVNKALPRVDLPPPPKQPPTAVGELDVQVVRTFGNGLNHDGIGILTIPPAIGLGPDPIVGELRNASRRYDFATGGERGIFNLIANAIRSSRRFIYVEDQYLVSEQFVAGGDSIAERLADKVAEPDFKKLVILMSRTEAVNPELRQAWRRRRAFLGLIKSADLTKVIACHYKVPPNSTVDTNIPTFVHSKAWIFDDEFCIVSSANCNRRGYTHDSEAGAGVFDPVPNGDRLNFARALRIRLWMRHLNPQNDPSITQRDLLDPIAASRFWRKPPPFAEIEEYDEDGDTRQPPTVRNPSRDGRLPLPIQQVTGKVLTSLDDDWELVIDPDGS